jgi:hypothetical protein
MTLLAGAHLHVATDAFGTLRLTATRRGVWTTIAIPNMPYRADAQGVLDVTLAMLDARLAEEEQAGSGA